MLLATTHRPMKTPLSIHAAFTSMRNGGLIYSHCASMQARGDGGTAFQRRPAAHSTSPCTKRPAAPTAPRSASKRSAQGAATPPAHASAWIRTGAGNGSHRKRTPAPSFKEEHVPARLRCQGSSTTWEPASTTYASPSERNTSCAIAPAFAATVTHTPPCSMRSRARWMGRRPRARCGGNAQHPASSRAAFASNSDCCDSRTGWFLMAGSLNDLQG